MMSIGPSASGWTTSMPYSVADLLKKDGASAAAIEWIGDSENSALHVIWKAAILRLRGVPLWPREVYRLKGGNQKLPDAFAEKLGEPRSQELPHYRNSPRRHGRPRNLQGKRPRENPGRRLPGVLHVRRDAATDSGNACMARAEAVRDLQHALYGRVEADFPVAHEVLETGRPQPQHGFS